MRVRRVTRHRAIGRAIALGLGLALLGSTSQVAAAHDDARTAVRTAAAATAPPTVVAAGDISPPWLGAQRATAALVLRLAPTRVLALGDVQYEAGTLPAFRAFYGPTWGRFKARTSPVPGNHEYETPGASGYFAYFGRAAGPWGRGYYSFDLGSWHLVALNSSIARSASSGQGLWLRADLAATSKRCVLAFWHSPRFSSGSEHGNDNSTSAFWSALYAARAEVVLNGHEHNYERFGPQSPSGLADPRGIREFVVGTGGRHLYPFGRAKANSQARITGRYGVLQLTLGAGYYVWRFVGVDGAVLDRGGPVACS